MEVTKAQLIVWATMFMDSYMRARHHKALEEKARTDNQVHVARSELSHKQAYNGRAHALRMVLCDVISEEPFTFNAVVKPIVGDENDFSMAETYATRLLEHYCML